MKFDQSKWINMFKSWISTLKNKNIIQKVRITYGVFWNLFLIFMIIFILLFSFAGGVGAGYFASLVKDEPVRPYDSMKKDIYNYEETSELYFANNVYLGKLYSDIEREKVSLEDISEDLINAVIATEDEYFYEHNGIVPKAILRALLQEATNAPVQTGGSTLTQQLIKNQILTNEVSFERKAKEILLALRLEKFFSKEEILEAYLNVSTFGRNSSGRNIAGVQSAAKGIFGVNANEVNLPQAAFIAGLPQSPFGYTPYTNKGDIKNNLEPGISRMQTVLARMHRDGKITTEQYEEALAYDITKDFITVRENPVDEYPWVTFEIEKRAIDVMSVVLAKQDGYKEEDLEKNEALKRRYLALADRDIRQNGYKIHSTIHKDIYDAMRKVTANFPYYGSDRTKASIDPETGQEITVPNPVETGSILIENQTGKIISFVGGRDYNREQLNHATNAYRSNGSTMKPLLVFAPAIELGVISPGSIVPDVPLKLDPSQPNKLWPRNFDGRYRGLLTAREALTDSYNVPTVKTYLDILHARPAQYLEKMGFNSLTEGDFVNPSTSIGGLTNGVTVEENTNAFSTFANNGKFVDAYMIEKITDKRGNIIYQHEVKPIDVFSPQTAYLTFDMMRDVISSGTASSLNRRLKFSSDWAGKTGTSQEYKDIWFVATNPNVTFGTWMGHDKPKPVDVNYKGLPYHIRNIYLWADLMNAAYDVAPELVDPSHSLKVPDGIVSRSFCSISGQLPSKACADAGFVKNDLFNAKYAPTEVDNSFIGNGRYVTIGNQKYAALESTPAEFIETGFIMNAAVMKKVLGGSVNPSAYIPNSSLASSAPLYDNGKTPSPLTISISGSRISWGKHPDYDVIGYRVYSGGKRVTSIKAGNSLSYQVGHGSYYVTAVDIAGNESAPSNIVTNQPPEPVPVEPQVEADTEQTAPSPPDQTSETEE